MIIYLKSIYRARFFESMLGSTGCITFGILNTLSSESRSITGVCSLPFPGVFDNIHPRLSQYYGPRCYSTLRSKNIVHINSIQLGNLDAFHSSQSWWFLNLALLLLLFSLTPVSKPTWYIYCEIISGVSSPYLVISSPSPTLDNIWATFLSWSKWRLCITTLSGFVDVLDGTKGVVIVGLSSH